MNTETRRLLEQLSQSENDLAAAQARAEKLAETTEEAARYLAAALTGHELAADAPHVFRRGEVADLEAALDVLRGALRSYRKAA